MPFLRVMTFNMQLLPGFDVPIVGIHMGPASGAESESRAHRICDAFDLVPADDLPDVLVGNEVFHEKARDVLRERLAPRYPHMVEMFPDPVVMAAAEAASPGPSVLQDSGLFFASRHPIVPLPNGETAHFESYDDATDWDRFALKGIALVAVATPLGTIPVAFTHTQASSAREDENDDVRAKQFDQVDANLRAVLGNPPAAPWRNLVVVGDLNVRGDLGAVSSEWSDVFATGPTVLTTRLADSWRTFMHPPGLADELDPGFTNNNLEPGADGLPAGLLSRLDYVIVQKPAPRGLVAQHMRTRFRALSDHWSLEADLHRPTPRAVPSDAIELESLPKLANGLQIVPLDIGLDGSYQWVFVREPGTYTVFPPKARVELTTYFADNLSDARPPFDVADVTTMGDPSLPLVLHRNLPDNDTVGLQFVARKPFFIRARAVDRVGGFTGTFGLGILRHTGATPATAIFLEPWLDPIDPILPAGRPLGADDLCWFRARIDRARSGEAHDSTFEVLNATGHPAEVELLDAGFAPLGADSGAGPVLAVTRTTDGPETVFLRLRRSDINDVAFTAAWRSGLTYLRSDPSLRPMVLRCLDETGPDWWGADEINLKVRPDGMIPFLVDEWWDDADTNEILKLETLLPTLAFVTKVEVWVYEDDFVQDDATIVDIPALGPGDPTRRELQRGFDVQSGRYQFEGTLDRLPD